MTEETPGSGHNGGPDLGGIAADRLKAFLERMVRVIELRKEESKAHTADLKEIVSEAKGNGFDAKLLRKTANEMVRRRAMDKDDLDEEMSLMEIYFRAAGLDV